MDERLRLAYLEALGIPVWVSRAVTAHDAVGVNADLPPASPCGSAFMPTPPRDETSEAVGVNADLPAAARCGSALRPTSPSDVSTLDWDALRERVAGCMACALHASRTQTVFGVGNAQAGLLIIGEAPGQEEDRRGEPFVGRAGQLLDAMLQAIGLDRQTVYIANVLKCRPPNNRTPSLEETAACEGFLRRQIALIGPKLILSVGAVSARNLLGTEVAVGKLRGIVHRYGATGIPVLVTYHPAYLLRQPAEKAKAWEDLQLAAKLLRDTAPAAS
jgi:DNA polymerase